MVSDKLYYKLMGLESDTKSVMRSYIDDKKDPRSNFELLVDFDKELKYALGLPRGGNIQEARGRVEVEGVDKNQRVLKLNMNKPNSQNAILVVQQTTDMLNGLLRENGLTREKIQHLTLPEYQDMFKKVFGKNVKLPTQEMLNNFKKATQNLSITDPQFMKYAARNALVPQIQFGTLTETELWMNIAENKPVLDDIKKHINKGVKNFNQSISDVNMANALRVTLFVASYGAFGAIEALQNAMKREAIRDLPKRKLNIRKDVKKSTAIFNKKVETFKRSDDTRVDAQQESHKKVEERVQAREMQKTVEKALNINIDTPKNEHETYDLVPTKFNSAKDLMRALMIEGIDKGTTVDFEKLTIYKQPLKEFENVDKTDGIDSGRHTHAHAIEENVL